MEVKLHLSKANAEGKQMWVATNQGTTRVRFYISASTLQYKHYPLLVSIGAAADGSDQGSRRRLAASLAQMPAQS
jgi:hypothetical protein